MQRSRCLSGSSKVSHWLIYQAPACSTDSLLLYQAPACSTDLLTADHCAAAGVAPCILDTQVLNFAFKMMNFASKMMDFVLTMMDFVSKMMDFVSKMMDFVLKMKDFVLKMMNPRHEVPNAPGDFRIPLGLFLW